MPRIDGMAWRNSPEINKTPPCGVWTFRCWKDLGSRMTESGFYSDNRLLYPCCVPPTIWSTLCTRSPLNIFVMKLCYSPLYTTKKVSVQGGSVISLRWHRSGCTYISQIPTLTMKNKAGMFSCFHAHREKTRNVKPTLYSHAFLNTFELYQWQHNQTSAEQLHRYMSSWVHTMTTLAEPMDLRPLDLSRAGGRLECTRSWESQL